jgi:ABC-2 type transport system ATP-binding protein
MQSLAISVKNLSKKYGDSYALSDASFDVPLGTICGFVGPNGAGKTTTIRMLLGLISPSAGSASVLDTSINEPEKYLSHVGAMIEGPAFYPALSGIENLKVLATAGNFPHERINDLIALVGLEGRGGSKYKTYSLGMKQRLGIAAALLPNPKVLILDEPTNGLDPEGIQEIRDLLKKLASQGTTVFVSSHLLSEIEIISEYLVMLRKGKVVFAGPIRDLLAEQQPTLVIETANPSHLQEVAKLAQNAGYSGEIRSHQLHLHAPLNWAGELNELAFKNGIVISQLAHQLPNLEETFFEMTGEK